MKYLDALSNTLFYRRWARDAKALLASPERIDGHAVYGRLRRLRDDNPVTLFNENNKYAMCLDMVRYNPDNDIARQYMYSLLLLEKDMEGFLKVFDEDRYMTLPKHYQEALALICVNERKPLLFSMLLLGFCVYPYWHPSGSYIAFSTNSTRQLFHVQPDKLIEVFDMASDIQVYDVASNELITAPQVKTETYWETFPVFSADGSTVFFCRAAAKDIPDSLSVLHYNLCAVGFDPEEGQFSDDVRTIIDAEAEGKSISFPRPSYDGRYIMYTLSDYGQFSIWHHEADLWLYDIASGESVRLDAVNSSDTESFHNWNSGSRWFVFSSRRDDGRFTRLYIVHIDEQGNVGKPFMLPQKNPGEYYGRLFMSYNVPEFVKVPVNLDFREARRLIESEERVKMKDRDN